MKTNPSSPTELSVRTTTPSRVIRFSRWTLRLLVIGGAGLMLIPWIQTSGGTGRVVAYLPGDRQQEISAAVEGRIQTWHVQEGQVVAAGDPVVDLVDNDPEILTRLSSEQRAAQSRYQSLRTAVETMKLNLERQKALVEEGLTARRTLEGVTLDIARLQAELANAAAELSRVDTRLSRQTSMRVTAPVAGTILRIISSVGGGQIVKPGDTLATIVPDTDSRAVEIWIPGVDLPLVRNNQEVRLQFEGWPAVQFSGWPSVAVGTFRGRVQIVDAVDNGLGYFRVVVVPENRSDWPDSIYLRQGVRAQAWILMGKVRLGYELWRRFNGFPNSASEAPQLFQPKDDEK